MKEEYTCPVCGKIYKDKGFYELHMKTKHPEQTTEEIKDPTIPIVDVTTPPKRTGGPVEIQSSVSDNERQFVAYWNANIKGHVRVTNNHIIEAYRLLYGQTLQSNSSCSNCLSTIAQEMKSRWYKLRLL